MKSKISHRSYKNRVALHLGYRSWKHLRDVADRGFVFNLSAYPTIRDLFDRYDIKYWVKGIREKIQED